MTSDQPINIIIEGTDYTNPKAIALGLSKYPRFVGDMGYQRYTTVISAKWGNFRDFPWGKGLIDFEPEDEEQAMKSYRVWVRLIEYQGEYNWIIDRFHISTQRYQIQSNKHVCDFSWLEERFLKLGFHLVCLTQNAAAYAKAMESQEVSCLNTEVERAVQEQDRLRVFASQSILPKYELDISDMDVQTVVENITDWFEEVSPYTQPEKTTSDKIFLPSCS